MPDEPTAKGSGWRYNQASCYGVLTASPQEVRMYHKGQRVRYDDGFTTGTVEQCTSTFISVKLDGDGDRWVSGSPEHWRYISGAAQSASTMHDPTPAQQTGATAYAYAYGYLDQAVRAALSDLMQLCRGIDQDDTRSSALTLHRIEMTLSDRQAEAARQLTSKLVEADSQQIVTEFAARATLES